MIECQKVFKRFGSPPETILHGLTFTIKDKEFVSISGRSGSGKSTLLYLISSLDLPSEGDVLIDGKNLNDYTEDEIHQFRNRNVGFIFQFHYLLPELTALENVLLPARNLGFGASLQGRARKLLLDLGLLGLEDKYPGQLSGGEQQRVAIARALILRPRYLFADEPTGNLDTENARVVMGMIVAANKQDGTTVCLVTHDPNYAASADRTIFLVDGRIESDTRKEPAFPE